MSDSGDTNEDLDTEEARVARAAALRQQIQGRTSGPRSPRELADEAARRAAREQSEQEPDPGDQ